MTRTRIPLLLCLLVIGSSSSQAAGMVTAAAYQESSPRHMPSPTPVVPLQGVRHHNTTTISPPPQPPLQGVHQDNTTTPQTPPPPLQGVRQDNTTNITPPPQPSPPLQGVRQDNNTTTTTSPPPPPPLQGVHQDNNTTTTASPPPPPPLQGVRYHNTTTTSPPPPPPLQGVRQDNTTTIPQPSSPLQGVRQHDTTTPSPALLQGIHHRHHNTTPGLDNTNISITRDPSRDPQTGDNFQGTLMTSPSAQSPSPSTQTTTPSTQTPSPSTQTTTPSTQTPSTSAKTPSPSAQTNVSEAGLLLGNKDSGRNTSVAAVTIATLTSVVRRHDERPDGDRVDKGHEGRGEGDGKSSCPFSSGRVCFLTLWALAVTAALFLGLTIFLWVRLSALSQQRPALEGSPVPREDLGDMWTVRRSSVGERAEFWYASPRTARQREEATGWRTAVREGERPGRGGRKGNTGEEEVSGLLNQPRVTLEDISDFWYFNGRVATQGRSENTNEFMY